MYEKDIKQGGVLSLCWCGTNNTERYKRRKYVIAELCIWDTILNVTFQKLDILRLPTCNLQEGCMETILNNLVCGGW